jgi:hypothetical protein
MSEKIDGYTTEEVQALLEKSAEVIRDLVTRCQSFEKEAALRRATGLVEQLNANGFLDEDQMEEKVAKLASDPNELSLTERALDLASTLSSGNGLSLRGNSNMSGNVTHAFEAFLMGQD